MLPTLLKKFLDDTPVLSFIKDEAGKYLYVNHAFLKFFKIKEAEVLGKTDFEWLPESIAKQFSENDARVRTNNQILETIEVVQFDTGAVSSLVHKFPVQNADGQILVGGIAVDITDRLNLEAELRQASAELAVARDQAIEFSTLKSAFVSNVSHELRTPLGVILGMSELLVKEPLTNGQLEMLVTIQQCARSLLGLVNDILDLSKIETGKIIIDVAPFNLAHLVNECSKMMSDTIIHPTVKLSTVLEPGLPELIQGDQLRIRQCLLNLIANSIKFTEVGEIEVSVALSDKIADTPGMCFAVEDTGIGISGEDQKLLFQPFSQVDVSSTRKYQGSGLGLYISKQLVEAMGGLIFIESKKGKGTVCSFVIPFVPFTPFDNAGDNLAESSLASPKRLGDTGGSASHFDSPEEDLKSDFTAEKFVLLVEDSVPTQNLILKQLADLGINAQAVSNGRDAIELVSTLSFDLILMDCKLPVCDGFEATKAIRHQEKELTRRTPIIALTAGPMESDKEKCLRAGMDDYLCKPVHFRDLQAKVEHWLALCEV